MRRLLVALLAAALCVPASATALSERTQHDYTAAYYPALKRCGDKPGPHLRKVPGEPSARRFHLWTRKLDGMCRPLPKRTRQVTTTPGPARASAQRPAGGARAASPPSPSGGGACSAIPRYIAMRESGCNYNARNPSGAYGAYQIMPGTAQAYGCDLSTPAGQDACATRIWNGGAGSGNWAATR